MDKRFAEAIRRAGFTSNDSLARALKEKSPDAFQGVEPRSLGVKLGELGRGVSTWWRGRSDRLAALSELTGFDAGELVAALAQRDRGRWSFPEFSTLAPLDLLDELPADLGTWHQINSKITHGDLEDWMQRASPPSRRPHRLHPLEGIKWLTVPPGCGRGLLLAQFQAVGSVDVVVAETLEDAVAMATGGRPLVIAPRRAVKQDDLEALMRLNPERPVLVVSARACPIPTSSIEVALLPRWDWLVSGGGERRRLALVKGNQGGLYDSGKIDVFEWRPALDWRMRLIDWLEQRLAITGDTLFSRKGLGDWLQRFDPTSVWFSTPADLMALASLCHASGERKLPNPESVDAGARLLHHLALMDSRTESLLQRLVERRWRDATHEWLSPLPWGDWQVLVELEPRTASDAGNTKARKKVPPALDLEVLRREGFLAADSQGFWAFAQLTQARLVLRDTLMRWVSEGDIERWARPQIGDPLRQAAVDSVLTAMPVPALKGSIKAVLNAEHGSISALSAAEALFGAIAHKFGSGQEPYTPDLAVLPSMILRQHGAAGGYSWPPFTRPENEGDGGSLSWLLACWEWSLCAPPPPELPQSLVAWFPGWLPRGDDASGDWYHQLPQDLQDVITTFEEVRTGFDEAVRSAQRVVDRVGYRELVDVTQRGPLWAALMLVAAGRGQDAAEAAWWDVLFSLRQAQVHVIRSLEHEDADAIATWLLPSLLEATRGSGLSVLAVLGPIWIFMFSRGNASKVLRDLPAAAVRTLYSYIRALPLVWQKALEDRLAPDSPHWCWEAALTESSNPAALADRLLSSGTPHAIQVTMLWRFAPVQCMASACDPQHSWSSLLISLCPSDHSSLLAEEIARRDDLLPCREERLGWVLCHLRESRGQEAGLQALLNRLELR
ncbi:hypothetical protein [Aquabacterium sp.]|uniref:hypothetical protein n=1 Tax=Aquabacterium sp. TaxID=1872578 RepID=UPI002623B6E9|nr:hypothetical protein [Aquabacterium sp.]MDD2977119.1 hypothetical protein [Aquabacterium sp.]